MNKALHFVTDKNFLIYCREVGNGPLLTQEEEVSLSEKIRASDEPEEASRAKEKLIKANLRLVVKLAKEYQNLGLELADLISEGNIGLTRAAEKFDAQKGTRFSTYACYWIKQSIKRALSNKSRTIRLPIHLTQLQYSIANFVKDFEIRHGREPSDTEIASTLNISVKKIKNTKSALCINNFTFLDERLDEDGEEENSCYVQDGEAQDPALFVARKDEFENLSKEIISVLDERERYVIQRRFGLGDVDCYTLEQLGEMYGITRERIRQIETEALIKLRKQLEKKM